MAVELKRCIFDFMLVKPKCVLEAVVFINFQMFFLKKQPPLKRILVLPSKGQKCTFLVLHPFTFDNCQSEHPEIILKNQSVYFYLED